MQDSKDSVKENQQISVPLQDFLIEPSECQEYQNLIISISQLFTNCVEYKGKSRTYIWEKFLINVNKYIRNSNANSIDFKRCLCSGALIIKLIPGKILLFVKLRLIQKLFQNLSSIPSISTISKRIGQLSQLKAGQIPFISNFISYTDKCSEKHPGCNLDWSLYEIFYKLDNVELVCSSIILNNEIELINEKIIDSIIDDDNETFYKLVLNVQHKDSDVNQHFSTFKYKMPQVLSNEPTFASLCSFFGAVKCFSIFDKIIPSEIYFDEISKTDSKGRSPIHFASMGGSVEMTNLLIELGFNISQRDNEGLTPCHYSAMTGEIEVFRYLFNKGANIFSRSSSRLTPFHIACLYENINILTFIDEKNTKYCKPIKKRGIDPLYLACENGCYKVVSYLLSKLKNMKNYLEYFNDNLFTYLISAFQNGSQSCATMLLEQGMRGKPTDVFNYSLLNEASSNGHVDMMKMILQNFKRIDDSFQKKNVLKNSIINGHLNSVKLLIENGFAENLNKYDLCDLFLKAFGNMPLIEYLDQVLVIPYEAHGKIFMKQACILEDTKLIIFLLEKKCEIGYDLFQSFKKQNTPFMRFLKMQGVRFPIVEQNISFSKNKQKNLNSLNQIFQEILTDKEKQQLEEIQIYFQKIGKLSILDYYSLIDALSKFSTECGYQRNIQRCGLTGIIPSFLNVEMDGKKGTICAINEVQISQLLNKASNTFSVSFLKENSVALNVEKARICFGSEEQLWKKIFSYYQILSKVGYCYKFFFIYNSKSDFKNFELNIFNPMPEPQSHETKSYPNNIIFLKEWQTSDKLSRKNSELQNIYKKWRKFINQLLDLVKIIQNISSSNDVSTITQNLMKNNEKLDLKNLSESRIYEYGTMILDDLRKSISVLTLNQTNNSCNLNLDKIVEIIYSDDPTKKEIARNVILDIINHKKYHSWDSKILEISFLLKYSSSSSYFRLYNLLNKRIPSPSTVDSHFRKQIIEREKSLVNSRDIMTLLDRYWHDIKFKVADYLNEYNLAYSTSIDIESFKIPICLGCDAAAVTTFTDKIKNEKTPDKKKTQEEKKKARIIKTSVFKELVKGEKKHCHKFVHPNEISDDDSHFFFAILLQPFTWKFPCTVIHLTKSLNGHFSEKEAEDILQIVKIIDSHSHFQAKYFAADGETALDKYHELAFLEYEFLIVKIIECSMTFDDFFEFVKNNVKYLPILDMMHSEKSGRNRVVNNDIKIGENDDTISRKQLNEDLELNKSILGDTTSIGRMKDAYPIHLFQIKNAMIEFQKSHNASGLYIFIYSIILELYRNSFIIIEDRLSISKLILFLLFLLYNNLKALPENTSLRKNSKSAEFVWFSDRIGLIKLINTAVAIASTLNEKETSFCLGFERLSSYPDEQFFGNYRTHFNGNYTTKNAFKYAVKSTLSLDIQSDLSVTFPISKRENFAGSHLNFKDSKGENYDKYTIPSEFSDQNQIKEIAIDIHLTGTGEKSKLNEKTEKFIENLVQFFDKYQSYRNKTLSTSKGSGIVPRIVAINAKENTNSDQSKKLKSSSHDCEEAADEYEEIDE